MKISELIELYCTNCILSHSESLSKCSRTAVLVCRNIDATATSTFPHDALSVPWCGVPKNMTPYVDSLMAFRCSLCETSAILEWIKAFCLVSADLCNRLMQEPTLFTTIPPRLWARKMIGRRSVLLLLCQQARHKSSYRGTCFCSTSI